MKSKVCFLISIFSLTSLANGALQNSDSIMSESLKRQGMPLNSRQAQEETKAPTKSVAIAKNTAQKMEEQIEILERKVERLESKLARAESRERDKRQEQKEIYEAKKAESEKTKNKELTGLVFSEKLSSSVDKGNIGKFSVLQGEAEALASYENAPVETRTVPALKVCAVMADANRLSVEDFAFLGMSRDAAMNAVSQRLIKGQFTSSKELAEIEGIGPDGFSKIEDKIIAIKSENFSE